MEDSAPVHLRLMTEEDVTEEYVSWFRDTIVTEFLDSHDFSIEDARQNIREGRENRTHFMYAVIDKQSGLHIGNVKVGPVNWKHGISDLVTVIGRREFWGKGMATEAIKVGSQIAFKEYGIRKLSGGIADGNEGSLKAYIRSGWIIEARLKGHHIINGVPHDRIVVSCFNPECFPEECV